MSGGFNSMFGGGAGFGNQSPKQNKNQIVTNLYRSVLGREPDPNALMYYISQQEVDENAVRKQMVESEEHKNILEEFKKIAGLKKEIEHLKSDVAMEKKKTEDRQAEIAELNIILSHKSKEIASVKEELEKLSHEMKEQKLFGTTELKVDTGLRKLLKILFRRSHRIDEEKS